MSGGSPGAPPSDTSTRSVRFALKSRTSRVSGTAARSFARLRCFLSSFTS